MDKSPEYKHESETRRNAKFIAESNRLVDKLISDRNDIRELNFKLIGNVAPHQLEYY